MAGRYRIVERIGSGGTGEVYRVLDERTQTSAAVKLLRPGALRDVEQAAQLFEGAWTANLIRHPNIVAVYETGLCDEGPFIVMEDLRGNDVGRILERHGRLKATHATAIIEPVLLALAAAHSVGLVHGDVKPENVVVCSTTPHVVTVKLLDFGTTSRDSTLRQVIGTTEYLSPEQAAMQPLDHRSDIFSASVLLYELLTNTRPFHGPTASSTAYRIANLPCPSLAESGLGCHDALWSALQRGLEKDPARRYQSCREMLEALKPWLTTETPATTTLAELLPPQLLHPESLSIPVASGVMPRQPSLSIPSPESGARLAAAARTNPRAMATRSDGITRDGASAVDARSSETASPVLPSRFRGRFRVRAVVWQALDEYVKARRPASLRERLLSELEGEEARDLLLGTLQGIVYSELDLVTRYVERATERLFDGDVTWCRAAGGEAVTGVLAVALARSIPPTLSLLVTTRRICQIMGPLFDFGTWQASEGFDAKRATITLLDVDPICQGLRLFFLGLVGRAVEIAHGHCTVTVVRGDSPFTPRLIFDVSIA